MSSNANSHTSFCTNVLELSGETDLKILKKNLRNLQQIAPKALHDLFQDISSSKSQERFVQRLKKLQQKISLHDYGALGEQGMGMLKEAQKNRGHATEKGPLVLSDYLEEHGTTEFQAGAATITGEQWSVLIRSIHEYYKCERNGPLTNSKLLKEEQKKLKQLEDQRKKCEENVLQDCPDQFSIDYVGYQPVIGSVAKGVEQINENTVVFQGDIEDVEDVESMNNFPPSIAVLQGSVRIAIDENIKFLPSMPALITGDVLLQMLKLLRSLEGMPIFLEGSSYIEQCPRLRSLQGMPLFIDSNLGVWGCQNLQSLEGMPHTWGYINFGNCSNVPVEEFIRVEQEGHLHVGQQYHLSS